MKSRFLTDLLEAYNNVKDDELFDHLHDFPILKEDVESFFKEREKLIEVLKAAREMHVYHRSGDLADAVFACSDIKIEE